MPTQALITNEQAELPSLPQPPMLGVFAQVLKYHPTIEQTFHSLSLLFKL